MAVLATSISTRTEAVSKVAYVCQSLRRNCQGVVLEQGLEAYAWMCNAVRASLCRCQYVTRSI